MVIFSGIGVGRTLRDVDSDRGAETYDYVLAQKMAQETRSRNFDDRERQQRSLLDRDLDDYFTNSRSRSTSAPAWAVPSSW